ncbi:MAG: 4a-hydroxytetrahydrobiopterin dehydratase [Patescibacteria group bacterium]
MQNLLKKKCVPCEGGVKALSKIEVEKYLKEIPGWEFSNGKIYKTFRFKDFIGAINFVNNIAELAENENHHPDIHVNYNKVLIELWTHAINGLSENDFILAIKIAEL